jgi:hypothetical protein
VENVVDWKQAIEEERTALQRIAALLLSLADLAALACGRSLPLCAFMVWILRPAEAAASAYLDVPPDAMPAPRSGDARMDATHLARRFRALAHEMIRQAELPLRFRRRRRPLNWGRPLGVPRWREHPVHDVLVQAVAAEALERLDTS